MYNIMKGQAGNRLIIRHKERDSRFTCTSHYKDISEFFTFKKAENIEWYEVNGGNRIILQKCSVCGYVHTDGTYGNCGE